MASSSYHIYTPISTPKAVINSITQTSGITSNSPRYIQGIIFANKTFIISAGGRGMFSLLLKSNLPNDRDVLITISICKPES